MWWQMVWLADAARRVRSGPTNSISLSAYPIHVAISAFKTLLLAHHRSLLRLLSLAGHLTAMLDYAGHLAPTDEARTRLCLFSRYAIENVSAIYVIVSTQSEAQPVAEAVET